MRVLVIDDEENMRHLLSVLLRQEGMSVDLAADGEQGLAALEKTGFDAVLCDIRMPRLDGLGFLEALGEKKKDVPVIMMSAFGTIELAVEAMKQGAADFITKPFQGEEVILCLRRTVERYRLRQENSRLRRRLEEIAGRDEDDFRLVGNSQALRALIRQARKVAAYPSTVLITGESGTGKELVARGIHRASPRADKPFVAINCGSIPEALIESELFGYTRGAFTGADQDRQGLFQQADGGTLFLDEIGELPMEMQVRLLRVLQEQEIRQLGGSRTIPVDVRVIAATARDLEEEVRQGRFREDLFFRLNVVHLHIPPLRERLEDIPHLCHHFIARKADKLGVDIKGISPAALTQLMQREWPGNVRELENMIERAVILAEKKVILPENLSDEMHNRSNDQRLDDFLGTLSIKKGKKILEKRFIARALEATGGNKARAAELLEISYPSLLHKIREYGL